MRIWAPKNSKTNRLKSASLSKKFGQTCIDVNMINSCIVWKNNTFFFFFLRIRVTSYLNKLVSQTPQSKFIPANKHKLKYFMLIIWLPKLTLPYTFPEQSWSIRAWNINVKCLRFHTLTKWPNAVQKKMGEILTSRWNRSNLWLLYVRIFPPEYLMVLL